MKLFKYLLSLSLLFALSACITDNTNKNTTSNTTTNISRPIATSTPKPPKEEEEIKNIKEIKEDSYAHLGALSLAQEVVKNELIVYLQELESFNIDEIVRKTYPKLFNVINEQHFRQYLSTMMNSKDIILESYNTHITKIDRVKAFSNGTQFCQVDYNSDAKISLLNENLYKTESSINHLYDVLSHKYGKKNIIFDVQNRTIEIKREEKMIMIKEKDRPWKFIGDNLGYRRIYANILPPEVLSNLDR